MEEEEEMSEEEKMESGDGEGEYAGYEESD